MGKCLCKQSSEKEENYIVSPSNFVRVIKDNIRKHYKIDEIISEGAYGKVYLGTHILSGKKRAIKFIPIKGPKEDKLKNLLNEVNTLKKSDHANIIKIYEVYQDDLYLCIVNNLCTGGELFKRIVNKKHFSEQEAANYMFQMTSAICYLHSNNITHRDLKPENMLFENENENSPLILVDFGTSKHFSINTKMIERVGSLYYMAPEMISKNYDEKCDIWSLGVILYLMLSGISPFNGPSKYDIEMSIITHDPSFDAKVWSRVSSEAKDLIKLLLNKNSNERITAEEILNQPWMQHYVNKKISNKALAKSTLTNLGHFYITSKLQRATLSYIVHKIMASDDINFLTEVFQAIDTNSDGVISKKELKAGLEVHGVKVCLNIETIMKRLDENKNGLINFYEFLRAAINWETELSRERLIEAFKEFDRDGNGSISVDELIHVLGGNADESHIFLSMIREADANKNGELDLEEFCNFMEKIKVNNFV